MRSARCLVPVSHCTSCGTSIKPLPPALQALEGGEFACPGSVLPGRCAFDSVVSAASACSSMAACRSVVYYHNGTDSCSDPVAVLTTSLLTEDNAFIVPTADVLTKAEDTVVSPLLLRRVFLLGMCPRCAMHGF